MSEVKKIYFVASEAQPFFASGGLGDVIGSLPKRILKNAKGEFSVSVVLPLYSKLNQAYKNKLVYVEFPATISFVGHKAFADNNINNLKFPEETQSGLQIETQAFAFNKIRAVQLPANTENIIQAKTIIAPSKQTAQYDFTKLFPTF